MHLRRPFFLLLASTVAATMGFSQTAEAPALPTKLPPMPESAKPTSKISQFSFMVGDWLGVNPNGTVNEETWTPPRGNHMVGTFRQVRRDGKPAFVEVSLLSIEKEGVRLRVRHLHGGLEVPAERARADDFGLVSVGKNTATFAGTESAVEVRVTYRLLDKNRLAVEVGFAPGSKEKGFTSVYFRQNLK